MRMSEMSAGGSAFGSGRFRSHSRTARASPSATHADTGPSSTASSAAACVSSAWASLSLASALTYRLRRTQACSSARTISVRTVASHDAYARTHAMTMRTDGPTEHRDNDGRSGGPSIIDSALPDREEDGDGGEEHEDRVQP
jgi:hypothetical protein